METLDLVLKLDDFSFTLDELGLLAFKIVSLLIDQLVHIINSGQLLGNVILKSPSLSSKITTLPFLDAVVVAELVEFFSILHVPFPQIVELIFKMLLLRT